jgi:hypothetical protein
MAYIGKSIESGTFSVLDTSGNTYNGSNTTFNLGTQVGSVAQLLVSHDGVIQKPGTDYTLASGGTQITFTTAPASGASIFIVEISGAVGGPLDSDLNGTELILDADGDTSLHASTDDQIDIKIAGADDFKFSANAMNVLSGSTLTIDSGATITNSGTASGFGVALDDVSTGDAASTLATSAGDITIDAQGSDTDIIFKGTDGASDTTFLTLDGSDLGTATFNGRILTAQDGDGTTCAISSSNDTNTGINFRPSSNADQIDVLTGGTTRLRIRDNGAICSERGAGHSSSSTLSQASDQGMLIRDGDESIYASSSGKFTFNRSNADNTDRDVLNFLRNGSNPGSISATDGTVSYNTFIGSHWSQLSDNSKPTILVGTVIESIDELCDWPMVKFTIPANKSPTGVDKVMREYISKPYTVGANIKHTFEGVEYDGVVELETQNEHLPKCKISDTEDSIKVYGVFRSWDDNDKVNDLSVASLGAYAVRIHKDETVAIGNLLSSKGDGTAKVQSDGNFKNTTIAKVTSTTKIETYSDGSYTVPCTLHCG